jgi:isoquinoline 1-oxidoreductase
MAPGFLAESVDKKGKIDQFSTNGSDHWYDIPNHYVRSVENTTAMAATPPGQLRAVAPTWTWWANESFIDEVAHQIGKDPLDMRLSMLSATGKNAGTPPNTVGGANRLRNALIVAAGKSGYGVKPMPENTAMGIASVASQERGSPSWTAVVAEVHVDPSSGEPTLKKITVAMDVGTAVNPDGVLAQIQGSALFGSSRVLHENVTMTNGAIDQGNFDTWTPMRIHQAPEIDVTIIQNGHYPAGCGEPVVTCVGPAIANAVFNASGARVRSWPITAEKIKAAQRGA